MSKTVRVGTRDSALAMWQTEWVVTQLRKLYPDLGLEIVPMKTQGDKILDVALAKIGDKGLFTKELEVAMLAGKIDMAVHSMKDLPTRLPDGLALGAICVRENPGDVLISPKGHTLATLPQGAKVATSSLRRRAQLLAYRPDLQMVDMRGNLATRFRKMEEQQLDGMILAAAGVLRLGWQERITQYIPFEISLPAVGQGSIGIEIRKNDEEIKELLRPLNDRAAAKAILAERAFLRKLEGGCQIPIGAYGVLQGEELILQGVVASLDGRKLIRKQINGNPEAAEELGERLAELMLAEGADRILAEVRELS
ncbi:hydroxymethylbilane synthase [Carboxydocella sp. JDF658]|uniref:hydroxymethylbilane synthase n=1 Tax=Carboxydocella sp. JDF658 TaxID=1926600 RepID=UPI0009AEC561|nr:hydroxymethylbilane synthase [Carboxydocella sp. JDF658]GAW30423.1 hydroxymethylbilane synthase [Carboxydocella sp. JDF658]